MASFLQSFAGIRSDDIIYVYLPLYHSAGFLMGLCGAIEKGVLLDSKNRIYTLHSDLRQRLNQFMTSNHFGLKVLSLHV